MREIKFRAWDKNKKKIVEVITVGGRSWTQEKDRQHIRKPRIIKGGRPKVNQM